MSVNDLDLMSILNQDEAYVGFTAATGGQNQNHDISSWYFNNDSGLIDPTKNTYSTSPLKVELEVEAGTGPKRSVHATVKDIEGKTIPNYPVTFSLFKIGDYLLPVGTTKDPNDPRILIDDSDPQNKKKLRKNTVELGAALNGEQKVYESDQTTLHERFVTIATDKNGIATTELYSTQVEGFDTNVKAVVGGTYNGDQYGGGAFDEKAVTFGDDNAAPLLQDAVVDSKDRTHVLVTFDEPVRYTQKNPSGFTVIIDNEPTPAEIIGGSGTPLDPLILRVDASIPEGVEVKINYDENDGDIKDLPGNILSSITTEPADNPFDPVSAAVSGKRNQIELTLADDISLKGNATGAFEVKIGTGTNAITLPVTNLSLKQGDAHTLVLTVNTNTLPQKQIPPGAVVTLNYQPTADQRKNITDSSLNNSLKSLDHFPVTNQDNQPPEAKDGQAVVTTGQPFEGQLVGTDVDAGDILTYKVLNHPTHGTVVVETDGKYKYTPTANFTGLDRFDFIVNDGTVDSAPATIILTINQIPVAQDTQAAVQPDGKLSGHLTAKDSDPGDRLTYVIDKQPEHGTVTIESDGTYTYIPEAGYTGPDSFTFTVSDGKSVSAPATVNLSINEMEYSIELTASPLSIAANGISQSQLLAQVKDKNGDAVQNVMVDFNASPYGQFVDENGNLAVPSVVTDVNGQASIRYQSEKVSSVSSIHIEISATVNEPSKGITGYAGIVLWLEPAVVSGVITNTDPVKGIVPVGGALVTIRDESGVALGSALTASDGSYSIPIVNGNQDYWVETERMIGSGSQAQKIIYKQKVTVGEEITGEGQVFPSNQTLTGVIGSRGTNGSLQPIQFDKIGSSIDKPDADPAFKAYLLKEDGTYTNADGYELSDSGVFVADGLPADPTQVYELEIRYEYNQINSDGQSVRQSIVINQRKDGSYPKLRVGSKGEMNINEELIDPFGVVTDVKTGLPIPDTEVTLIYSDTPRNRAAGIIPGSKVHLPSLPGFVPSDNANEQRTDGGGNYAFMVFADTDYIVTATHSGYSAYRSANIEVNRAIVHWDFSMEPLPTGSGSDLTDHTSNSNNSNNAGISTNPPAPTTPKPENVGQANVKINMSIDHPLYEENSTASIRLNYSNESKQLLKSGTITMTLPEGAVIVDAAGGKVNGQLVVWSLTDLNAGSKGTINIRIQFPKINTNEKINEVKAVFSAGTGEVLHPANGTASLKLLVFSNRFGVVSHDRYILGYPSGKFNPQGSLTRAELAAITARLLDDGKTDKHATFADVSQNHWASGYISIATENGIFTGYADGSFHPDQAVTREELAAVMVRFLKLESPESIESHFTDMSGRWSSAAVETLLRNAMLQGYKDGAFRPLNAITRLEAVTLINHALFRGPLQEAPQSFPDIPSSHWGFGQVEEATLSHDANRNSDGSEKFIKQHQDQVN
ncbi:Ig-like domain-containing protein [Paenibacillus pini]|uniref:SLH domain-containing protein n=1 Tax=Paenibacillus pini JCM 16418 TaxID=1236976 RepID=W7YTQ9_9BACL|nr:Ig-like domain-containing protein [Paenibacillus pini]GAF10563.1 hypothetical protein JCM16418_4774 [Paenibacillus pini JCM 16418]